MLLSSRILFDTKSYKLPSVYLQHLSCLIQMMQVANTHIKHKAGHNSSRKSVKLARLSLEQACEDIGALANDFWKDIPKSVPELFKQLNLDVDSKSELCGPECFAIHGKPSPANDENRKLRCDSLRFFKTVKQKKKGDLTYPKNCNTLLYSNPNPRGGPRSQPRPHWLFHHQSLKSWLVNIKNLSLLHMYASFTLCIPPSDRGPKALWETNKLKQGTPYSVWKSKIIHQGIFWPTVHTVYLTHGPEWRIREKQNTSIHDCSVQGFLKSQLFPEGDIWDKNLNLTTFVFPKYKIFSHGLNNQFWQWQYQVMNKQLWKSDTNSSHDF